MREILLAACAFGTFDYLRKNSHERRGRGKKDALKYVRTLSQQGANGNPTRRNRATQNLRKKCVDALSWLRHFFVYTTHLLPSTATNFVFLSISKKK